MRKILIFYASYGGGHLSAANSIKQYIDENNLDVYIEADGGINTENSEKLVNAGCDIIVSGTAITKSNNFAETIKKLKNAWQFEI